MHSLRKQSLSERDGQAFFDQPAVDILVTDVANGDDALVTIDVPFRAANRSPADLVRQSKAARCGGSVVALSPIPSIRPSSSLRFV